MDIMINAVFGSPRHLFICFYSRGYNDDVDCRAIYTHLRTTTVQHAAAVVHSRDYRCRNYLLLYRSRESGLEYDDMVGRSVSAGADRVSCKEFVCNGYCGPRRGGCAVWN